MFRSYTEKVFRPNVKTQPSQSSELPWYSCDICDLEDNLEAQWLSETDVELHRKDVHEEILYQQMREHTDRFCTVCMTLQESPTVLLRHIKQRHLYSSPTARKVEREIYICDYCQHVFFNKAVLQAHIQYLHMWNREERMLKSFTCPKCNKSCKLKSLWFHMQNHDIPSLSICDICLLVCPNVTELMTHVREHPLYYTCQICGYQTSKEAIFESHLKNHKMLAKKPDMVMVRRLLKLLFLKRAPQTIQERYNIHHPMKGLIVPPLVHICILCKEICMDKTEMTEHVICEHMFTPEPTKKPSFLCSCGAEFPSRVLFRHHAFKMKGAHREVLVKIVVSTPQEEEVPHLIIKPPDSEVPIKGNNKPVEEDPTWIISPDIEIELLDTKPGEQVEVVIDSESNSEMVVEEPAVEVRMEESDDLMYMYATVNDDVDDLVTIEQDGGRIISF